MSNKSETDGRNLGCNYAIMRMRPVDHMPCSPYDATVATLGEAVFTQRAVLYWGDGNFIFATDQIANYGASFWKPVPNPPENTRELTEEEMASGDLTCWLLTIKGSWRHGEWAPRLYTDEPWRCRVPIEAKVVAVKHNHDEGFLFEAYFDTEELRDRAVKEANERANGREL